MVPLALTALPWMAALCTYDWRSRRLPNWLTIPGAGLIMAAAAFGGYGLSALAGGAALAALYLVTHLVSARGMGAGDVKLALGIGALTGTFGSAAWFLSTIMAPLFTVAAGLLVLRRSEPESPGVSAVTAARRIRLPHGPSMCAAAVVAIAIAVAAGE
ncbi:A24 family peptidase [Hoyosella sp. YIM 151337]|uniref:A24 family peptidase n=1 Tax=Hoyosella sp. YIM 151337 TaxID=2992742 RepID=UPI002235A535|nr:A24 family peptidase [Hoyosella sp. YIM 151337]MCW4353225.1 A24 family peptidase [Hoyosella sp. YIM 151337]